MIREWIVTKDRNPLLDSVFYSSMCYLWEIILSHTLAQPLFNAQTYPRTIRSNSVFYVLAHTMSPVSNDFATMYQLSDVYLVCGMPAPAPTCEYKMHADLIIGAHRHTQYPNGHPTRIRRTYGVLLLTQPCRRTLACATQMQYVRFGEFVIRTVSRPENTTLSFHCLQHNRQSVFVCFALFRSSLDFCGTMYSRVQCICCQYLPIYGVFGWIMPSLSG